MQELYDKIWVDHEQHSDAMDFFLSPNLCSVLEEFDEEERKWASALNEGPEDRKKLLSSSELEYFQEFKILMKTRLTREAES